MTTDEKHLAQPIPTQKSCPHCGQPYPEGTSADAAGRHRLAPPARLHRQPRRWRPGPWAQQQAVIDELARQRYAGAVAQVRANAIRKQE